jgi:hypothetical protein
MYPDTSKSDVGIFDINWDDESIELKGGQVSIRSYVHDLIHPEDYPIF